MHHDIFLKSKLSNFLFLTSKIPISCQWFGEDQTRSLTLPGMTFSALRIRCDSKSLLEPHWEEVTSYNGRRRWPRASRSVCRQPSPVPRYWRCTWWSAPLQLVGIMRMSWEPSSCQRNKKATRSRKNKKWHGFGFDFVWD